MKNPADNSSPLLWLLIAEDCPVQVFLDGWFYLRFYISYTHGSHKKTFVGPCERAIPAKKAEVQTETVTLRLG